MTDARDEAAAQARPTHVLVVDDDAVMRELLQISLTQAGFAVTQAANGHELLAALDQGDVDLVLLDLVLAGESGTELLSRIRRTSDVPVIILSGRTDDYDRLTSLQLGADDFVTKPFSVPELMARVEAVTRRAGAQADKAAMIPGAAGAASLSLDAGTREVFLDGQVVELTAKEFDLLAYLCASPRQVFTRDQLLDQVWGSSGTWQDSATVTEHVRRIRRKLGAGPSEARFIETVRGVGYRFTG